MELEQRRYTPEVFTPVGSRVQVWRPGVYDVQFMLQIPADAAVSTTVVLQMNNQDLPDMTVVIQHPAGASAIYTARTILEVTEPSAFRLSSSARVSITGPGTLAAWQFLLVG